MNKISHYIVTVTMLAAFSLPLVASAHATPVAYSPDSSVTILQAPTTVSIHFSERLDIGASAIIVKDPSGEVVSQGNAHGDPTDRRLLSVPIKDGGKGTYLVSWSVVSADDGHFTKGAYPFAVGAGIQVQSSGSNTEIVTITTTSEALGMAVELMGNGIIWAVLLLFIFAVRPLFRNGKFESEQKIICRGYAWILLFAIFLVFTGGVVQIIVKTQSLAGLRDAAFWQTLPLYIQTVAGSATLYRLLAVGAALTIFVVGRNAILRSKKITAYEVAIMLAMCVFAFFRAIISHATANPFHPHLSVAVNFVHLIEKDFWAGAVGILAILAISRRMRPFLLALIPRSFEMLAIDFAVISVTACYIVWLHLKSFANLFTTQWGGAFLQLLIVAILLVGMRVYHVLARLYRPSLFSKLLPASLAMEFAFGILVVYCSSVVIITSPPLPQPHTTVFSAVSNGVTLTLERDASEDNMLMLTANGKAVLQTPVVTIADQSGLEPLSVALSPRFNGGYVFPTAFLAGQPPFTVSVTVPQVGGYDAQATFKVNKNDFEVLAGYEATRSFDQFTIVMILIALSALVFAGFVWWLSSWPAKEAAFTGRSFVPEFSALGAFLIASFLGANVITAFGASALSNPYKAECESDGNMWHLMLPSRAGKPVSQISQEGCMWGMGNFMYQFPDKREYDYNKNLAKASVTLEASPKSITSGVPTTLTVSLKEPDGSPAKLFVDMEKLIHVVIVSKDESVFAHIHPDDIHPLTKEEIDTSTFTVEYTFPKAGSYLVSIDYAHGLTLESKQFTVDVGGLPSQTGEQKIYPSPGIFYGYTVSLDYFQPFAGQVTTLKYTIKKDGNPVTNVIPYLSAAMHVSIVKNDFSTFIHTHGEVHPPGVPYPPIIIKNGQVVHSMAMMVLPPTFGPLIDAHLIFPSAGLYTVWAEFKVGDKVIPTSFSVRVE